MVVLVPPIAISSAPGHGSRIRRALHEPPGGPKVSDIDRQGGHPDNHDQGDAHQQERLTRRLRRKAP
jgi:hypothetical protein